MVRTSTLSILAAAQYGSVLAASVAVGVSPNTLLRASHGCGVSAKTREKIESAFGMPLETLQRPISDVVDGAAK